MLHEEKNALMRSRSKFCDLPNIFARLFAFHFCLTTSFYLIYLFSFLRDCFQLKLLKTMKTDEWYINQRLEANIKAKVKRVTTRDSFS